jgi:hypothetical protein
MPIGRQDASVTLSIVVSSELKRVVRTHNAKYVWIYIVAIVFTSTIMLLVVVQSCHTLLGILVMLCLRQSNVFPVHAMHDVEHALTILVSHEKVFGVLFATTNRESIYRPTIGWDAM